MSHSSAVPVPAPVSVLVRRDSKGGPDCERLDAYRLPLEFQVLAASLIADRRLGALRDQIDRASVSIVLNVAEGCGRFAPAEKAHFYLIARGSAMESLAALSLMKARALISPEVHRRGRSFSCEFWRC